MERPVLNAISELLTECSKYNNLALYGCGNVGKLVLSFLDIVGMSWKVDKVYVSDYPKAEYFFGKKLISIKEAAVLNECIIVSTSEQYHRDINNNLSGIGCDQYVFVSDRLISELRLFESCRSTGNNIIELKDEIFRLKELVVKSVPLRQLQFSVDITEHCNLNCAGCNHFSPLADEEFLDIDSYKKDMERLGHLADGDAYRIELMGGEPLLNPRALEYAVIARRNFPKARIAFLSNGLLVKRMPDSFFESCIENDISLDLTPYPIGIDYDELFEYIKSKGLKRSRFQTGENYRIWRKWFFDLNPDHGSSQGTDHWLNCIEANNCMNLRDGKMSCVTMQKIKHFMKAFPEQTKYMYFSERDFINIYKIDTVEEIFDFFSKPFPFCKYCKTRETQEVEWSVSTKDISEWV